MKPIALFLFGLLCLVIGCAHKATNKEQASAKIHYDIGVESFNQGDLRAALKELMEAVAEDPDLYQAHNALGLVYHALGKTDLGLEHYNIMIKLKPDFSEGHNNRGTLLLDLEQYDEAIKDFEIALSDILYATPSLAEGNLGWAYYKKGDLDKGRQHLRNAVAANPKFCRGFGWLAEIEIASHKPDQVLAYCKRFEKNCAEDAQVAASIPPDYLKRMKLYLGQAYQALGDIEAARQAWTACAANPAENGISAQCAQLLSGTN